jgi:hypothetical protein
MALPYMQIESFKTLSQEYACCHCCGIEPIPEFDFIILKIAFAFK